MNLPNLNRSTWIVIAACAALSLPALASAQSVVAVDPADLAEMDIDRDSATLEDEIRPRPKDVDVADTLLIFTNTTKYDLGAACVAYNRSGTPIGRARLAVPANGLKFMTASDLSNGRDFIGRATCFTRKGVISTAIFVGPEIENLNVTVGRRGRTMRADIPLVATY